MANRLTKGKAIFGDIGLDTPTSDGFSSIVIGSGLVITPDSSIPAAGDLFTTYTTGLTALSLAANDFVVIHPLTNLASGINFNVIGALNGIKVHWQNGSGTAVTINSTTWDVFAIKRT